MAGCDNVPHWTNIENDMGMWKSDSNSMISRKENELLLGIGPG